MKKAINQRENEKKGFALRGLENTRIESLSDGVFAIAIGLLLISSSPPNTFAELQEFTKQFIPFGFTISLLMYIWYEHYVFFIRFGLKDHITVAVNTVLLFLILFYVYPLKFLFSILVESYRGMITGDGELLERLYTETIHLEDTSALMTLYGLGAAAIFGVLALLNYRALRKKDELKLSKREQILTTNTIRNNVVCAAIPLLSAIVAITHFGGSANFAIAGMLYMTYGIGMPISGKIGTRRLEQLDKEEKK